MKNELKAFWKQMVLTFPTLKKIGKILFKVIWIVAKIFTGAILWWCLGNFLPQLRETMPNFFQIVDVCVHFFETEVSATVVRIFTHQ